MDAARESHRDTRGLPWLAEILRDIRFGLRMISKHAWFAAIGIGANLTAFSLAKAVLWQPLPVANSDRLIAVYNIPLAAAASITPGAGTYKRSVLSGILET